MSMVLREVALMTRVTDRPKKLNPLRSSKVSRSCAVHDVSGGKKRVSTHPIDIMIRTEVTAIVGLVKTSLNASEASK